MFEGNVKHNISKYLYEKIVMIIESNNSRKPKKRLLSLKLKNIFEIACEKPSLLPKDEEDYV